MTKTSVTALGSMAAMALFAVACGAAPPDAEADSTGESAAELSGPGVDHSPVPQGKYDLDNAGQDVGDASFVDSPLGASATLSDNNGGDQMTLRYQGTQRGERDVLTVAIYTAIIKEIKYTLKVYIYIDGKLGYLLQSSNLDGSNEQTLSGGALEKKR
jgi:hypothetical protein